jgi:hypothetical protein
MMSRGRKGDHNEKERISEKGNRAVIKKAGGGLCRTGGKSQHHGIIKI